MTALMSTGWLIFTSIAMALGKEATVTIQNEWLQAFWLASIGFASLLSVGCQLLLNSTIDPGD